MTKAAAAALHRQISPKHAMLLEGSPMKGLIRFAIPVISGNIFQQLYNIVDAAVVGKFLGSIPLTGISVASPFMDVLYALILGSCVGLSVILGREFGAGDFDRLRKTHATALTGGAMLTLFLSLVGLFGARPVLAWQGVSPEALEEAVQYLNIIFSGLIFCFLFNYLAAALRATGDSRTPFLVLSAASTIHAVLDMILVGKLGMGIRGVACSTVFSQFLSAAWMAVIIYRGRSPLAAGLKEMRPDFSLGAALLAFSWVSAIQQAVVSIGRMLIQGMLTGLGNEAIAGYNMGMRTEQFLFCFSQGISAAVVVAVSQNLGRGSTERVKRFYWDGFLCEALLSVPASLLCIFVPAALIGVFSRDPVVVAAGVRYTGFMGYVYVLAFCNEFLQGFFRGLGRLKLTMAASLMQIITRVAFSALLVPHFGIRGICYAVLIGWALLFTSEGLYSSYLVRHSIFPGSDVTKR